MDTATVVEGCNWMAMLAMYAMCGRVFGTCVCVVYGIVLPLLIRKGAERLSVHFHANRLKFMHACSLGMVSCDALQLRSDEVIVNIF